MARWYVFRPKITILGKFWKAWQWKMLVFFVANFSILLPNGSFYGHLVHFVVIWLFFPVLVCRAEKNLATLVCTRKIFGPVTLTMSWPARRTASWP
jgi:hypothetical protein